MKILIVGAGKFGYKLAEEMLLNDLEVTIIDNNNKVLERIENQLDVLTVHANGVQIEVLRKLNIEHYEFAVAATNSDETNIVICSMVKKMGCKKTIARVRNPEYSEELKFIKKEMNIDYIINPELALSEEISRYLLKRYNFYGTEFVEGKISMFDVPVHDIPEFIGKRLKELEGMEELLISAISRKGQLIIPHGDTLIGEDDVLYIIGTSKGITILTEKIKNIYTHKHIKRCLILGGGRVGYYLAKRLEKAGIKAKIIEQNRERCAYLSEKLDKALIINGDGSDINLLEEEDLNRMDAFVGVTDFDEVNLLMSLIAKQSGISQVISKVSRPNYVRIIETLGVDVALNPINISIGNILKFIIGGRVVSVSLLLGDEAEVLEVILGDDSLITGKPIGKLGLPKGIIIGGIGRGEEAIIPKGDTILYPGDRLVVFFLVSEYKAMDAFLGNKKKKGFFFRERK